MCQFKNQNMMCTNVNSSIYIWYHSHMHESAELELRQVCLAEPEDVGPRWETKIISKMMGDGCTIIHIRSCPKLQANTMVSYDIQKADQRPRTTTPHHVDMLPELKTDTKKRGVMEGRVSLNHFAGLTYFEGGLWGLPLTNLLIEVHNVNFLS